MARGICKIRNQMKIMIPVNIETNLILILEIMEMPDPIKAIAAKYVQNR